MQESKNAIRTTNPTDRNRLAIAVVFINICASFLPESKILLGVE